MRGEVIWGSGLSSIFFEEEEEAASYFLYHIELSFTWRPPLTPNGN